MILDERALEDLLRRVVREELGAEAPAKQGETYLSVARAGEIAEVTPGTIRSWMKAGKLETHRAGRELRVKRSDLERLLASPATDATPEALARAAVAAEHANPVRRSG